MPEDKPSAGHPAEGSAHSTHRDAPDYSDTDLEYTGLMATAWDPLRGDTSGWKDRAFFLNLIGRIGQPVLDVGCGTGRLLLDYLGIGIDIDGFEISPDMTAILRAKADSAGLDVEGRVHLAAMETVELPRRYRLVIVPSASFQLIIGEADAARAMRRFFELLEPGGALGMAWIDLAHDYGGVEERFVKEAPLGDGSIIRRTFRGWFDLRTNLDHSDDLYERLRDGAVIASERKVRSPATRNYSHAAIGAMHDAAGFADLELFSVGGGAPKAGDRVVMSVARRPP